MSSFPRTLSVGMKGKDAALLQKTLLKAGHEFPFDELKQGRFGKGTLEAVKKFQSDNRLNAIGVVNEATAKLLVKKIIERGMRTVITTTTTSSLPPMTTDDPSIAAEGVTVQADSTAITMVTAAMLKPLPKLKDVSRRGIMMLL